MLTRLVRDQLIRKTRDKRKINYINKARNQLIKRFLGCTSSVTIMLLYVCLSPEHPFCEFRILEEQ